MNVDHMVSTVGDIDLKALGSICDASINDTSDPSKPGVDLIGKNIILSSITFGIGFPGNDLDIQAGGTLTSSSARDTHITETTGDLSLNTVTTASAFVA